jgi:BirA family transcriptional regulator, biotin operon repressor / biotin---[acetyl-CoA-carboxylase] ligase
MTDGSAIILNFKNDGLFDPIDPEKLAAWGAIWEKDVQRFSPWRKINHHILMGVSNGSVWQSGAGQGKHSVAICGSCTSSMDLAWHFIAQESLQVWDSILAVEQTAGRGQHQRVWMSPVGNIHAAWRWPHPANTVDLDERWFNFASLMAGYLMARIISEEFGLHIKIKWPNDLLVNEKKIGGILTEARQGQLVIGIGINIVFSPDFSQLRNDFAVQATNLQTEGVHTSPLSLWMKIAENGRLYWQQMTGSVSPEDFISALKPFLAWVGEKVLVKTMQQEPFEAIITGISDQGGLILKVDGKETVIYAGSIIPA